MSEASINERLEAAYSAFWDYEVEHCSNVGGYPAEASELNGVVAIASSPDYRPGFPELQMFTTEGFIKHVYELIEERDSWLADDDMEDIDD